jgi:hypothetical protein
MISVRSLAVQLTLIPKNWSAGETSVRHQLLPARRACPLGCALSRLRQILIDFSSGELAPSNVRYERVSHAQSARIGLFGCAMPQGGAR